MTILGFMNFQENVATSDRKNQGTTNLRIQIFGIKKKFFLNPKLEF